MAQAEEYSRQLVQQARERYAELLQHAQQQAQQAALEAEKASAQLGSFGGTDEERSALEQKIAYLRTFAEVTEVQLRSVLEALTREVNKLGDVSRIS
jgi:cell division initiation protein